VSNSARFVTEFGVRWNPDWLSWDVR